MGKWFKARWAAYLETLDPDAALSDSSPGQIVATVVTGTTVFLACGYVPFLQSLTGMRWAGGPVTLMLLGGALSLVAYSHKCRGPVGAAATLLDSSCYTSAIAFAAMSMRGNAALAMAAVHGVVLLYPARTYALTLLFGVTMALPILVFLITLQPELPVAFISVISTIVMLVSSRATAQRRMAAHRQKQLEEALDAADKVADASIQAALTTTLLQLGHFLHELRNYQTSISSNLEYIGINATLTPATREALAEAQEAQEKEEALVRSTIDELRSRSQPTQLEFKISEVLARVRSESPEARVEVDSLDFDLELLGNPEHLNVVLLNLVRNAEQAGASRVVISAKPEASGHAGQLLVHDDGPGTDPATRDRLFDNFALSTKPGGSGLGLYLVRRYVALLGGTVQASVGPLGGAAFSIRLPGRVVQPVRPSQPSGRKRD